VASNDFSLPRWLAHFYSMLWWEDKEDEKHCKRFARDALRYRDEVRHGWVGG